MSLEQTRRVVRQQFGDITPENIVDVLHGTCTIWQKWEAALRRSNKGARAAQMAGCVEHLTAVAQELEATLTRRAEPEPEPGPLVTACGHPYATRDGVHCDDCGAVIEWVQGD